MTATIFKAILGLYAQVVVGGKPTSTQSPEVGVLQRIFDDLGITSIARGAEPEGKEEYVGSLYDVPGLPQLWTLREKLRELISGVNGQQKEVEAAFDEATRNLHLQEGLLRHLQEQAGNAASVVQAEGDLVPLRETFERAQMNRNDFMAQTWSMRTQSDAVYTLTWEAVKASFPELMGHTLAFGVYGETLNVAWVHRDEP